MFFPSPAGLSEWLMAFTDDCQVEDCSPDHVAQRTFILRSRWAITRQLETQFMKVQALVQHGTLWWTNIAMEKSQFFYGKIHYKWPFSIAMLVHQRVNLSGSDIAVLVVLVRAAWLWELGSKCIQMPTNEALASGILHNEIRIAAKREATPVHGHFNKGRLWFSISHGMFYYAYSCLFYFLLVYYITCWF